jgi:hypothetical protein
VIQVWSRRITGVGDGLVQGTEAFAQGLAFGVSGVLRKPVESARQYGVIGIAPGIGRAFVGFIVQPLSGALDFFSLTVDGISASFMRCVNILSNKSVPQRIRDPRAIHRDGIVRDYDKFEAAGQVHVHALFSYCLFLFLFPFCFMVPGSQVSSLTLIKKFKNLVKYCENSKGISVFKKLVYRNWDASKYASLCFSF